MINHRYQGMKMKYFIGLILLLTSCVIFVQCDRVKDVILPHTELIFPLDSGNQVTTFVIDTTFDTSGPKVERYYKKEVIGGLEEDLLGRSINRLQTFRSPEELGTDFDFEPWRLYALYKDENEVGERYAERLEENVRFRILKFPVFDFVKWNGNIFNNQGTQEYYYAHTDTTVNINGLTFPNCVMVIQKLDTNSFINFKYAYEIYAPNVGRIKKYDKTIVNDGANGEFNASKSRIYIEEIVEHN